MPRRRAAGPDGRDDRQRPGDHAQYGHGGAVTSSGRVTTVAAQAPRRATMRRPDRPTCGLRAHRHASRPEATMTKKPAASKRTASAAAGRTSYVSPDQRRAQGRALRDAVSRVSHAGWKPAKGRRDPIEIVLASNEGRMAELIPIRFGRMAASPFAFYRGSAALMAADLATTPNAGLRVQACGDAHLMNFGGFATPERNVIFDINDLDETLPAPFEWDLKRLAASTVIAAQHLRLPDSDAARVAADTAREYRERIADYASMRALDVWYDRIDLQRYEDRSGDPAVVAAVRKRMAERIETEKRKTVAEHLYPKLVSVEGALPRIKDELPLIFHPTAEQAPGMISGFREQIASYPPFKADFRPVGSVQFHNGRGVAHPVA